MKIKIEIEVEESIIGKIYRIGHKQYKYITKEEEKWWDGMEKQVGAKVMVKIGKGEWEDGT